MTKKRRVRESKRLPYTAPVEIRWLDSDSHVHSVLGRAEDLSIDGLGVSVPFPVPSDKELSIAVDGVEVCGGAVLRHSQPCPSGFRIGLYFRLSLLMQSIPGVDELLHKSVLTSSAGTASILAAFTRRFALRLWRVVRDRTTKLPSWTVSSHAKAADNSRTSEEVIVSVRL